MLLLRKQLLLLLLLVQWNNLYMWFMKNLFLYLLLCIAGILIPVMLMRYVEGNIGVYLLVGYIFVFRPWIDKLRLEAKGVKSKKGSLWWKYPFWSLDCIKVLYSYWLIGIDRLYHRIWHSLFILCGFPSLTELAVINLLFSPFGVGRSMGLRMF